MGLVTRRSRHGRGGNILRGKLDFITHTDIDFFCSFVIITCVRCDRASSQLQRIFSKVERQGLDTMAANYLVLVRLKYM